MWWAIGWPTICKVAAILHLLVARPALTVTTFHSVEVHSGCFNMVLLAVPAGTRGTEISPVIPISRHRVVRKVVVLGIVLAGIQGTAVTYPIG